MFKIYVYEDENYKNLSPLVYLRPVFDIYCGMYTVRERIQKIYQEAKIYPLSRFDYQTLTLPHSPILFINGRAILHSPLPHEEGVFVARDEVVGFKIKNQKSKIKNLDVPVKNKFLTTIRNELKQVKVRATMIKYPWDLINENEHTIIKDFGLLSGSEKRKAISDNRLKQDGVFLMDEHIYVGNNVQIRPPTIIDGPCFIGDETIIDGAKIRTGTTIGRQCRIGGEVEQSVFSDFSNKHHEGFVGHSFIGEWANLGAGTITSDIKNTYGTVKVPIQHPASSIQYLDSGLLKVGAFIGDHTKTGIGTLLDTGAVIGCFVNIYGGGNTPKYIPSFRWGTKDEITEYKLEKAIEVAKRTMARRGVKLTKQYEQRIHSAFYSVTKI